MQLPASPISVSLMIPRASNVFRSLSENSSTREDTQKLGRTAAKVLEHRTTGLSRNAEGPLDAPFLLVCLDRILWMGAPN
jgi:hypothetical protein